mmetsp:Transcript_38931/g.97805  ORF Transcript_38931/g.97805 Transcript_38931/m.97805 type:complete len:191 (+) Transcript_38931:429-1001(+)
MNPFGKVPCLQDDAFTLPESASILRYLATKYHVADHWYPANTQDRAVVESAMDWSATGLRNGTARYGWHRVVGKNMGAPTSEDGAREALGLLELALQHLETIWLARTKFAGRDQISIADLLIVSELEQLRMLDGAAEGPYMADLLAPHPVVQQYMSRVIEALSSHYEDVASKLYKASATLKARREAQSRL